MMGVILQNRMSWNKTFSCYLIVRQTTACTRGAKIIITTIRGTKGSQLNCKSPEGREPAPPHYDLQLPWHLALHDSRAQ